MDYLLLKALHIASDLVWFAGVMLNGVVLSAVAVSPQQVSPELLRRVRLWDLWVSNPAQGLAWIFGIWMIVAGGWITGGIPDGWLLAKLALVFVLAGIHGSQSAALRKLAKGRPAANRLALTRASALIALTLALGIPLLAVLKPF